MLALPDQHVRAAMEATVEALIGLLDAIDGDENLEVETDGEDGGDAEPDRDGEGRGEWGCGGGILQKDIDR